MAVTLSISLSQASQNIPSNYSNVSFWVYAHSTNGSFNNTAKPGTLTLNGVNYNFSHNFAANVTTLLYSGTVQVPHNSDGTKIAYASASFVTGVSSGTIYASNQLTLTNIPRASVLAKPPDFTLGTSFNLGITKYDASFTDNLSIKVGTTEIRAASNISNGYTVNFTSDELNTIYALMPNSKTVTITYILTTVGKGTSTQTNVGTITDANPIFTNFTYAESSSIVNALTGGAKFVKGHSGLNIEVAGSNLATGNKSATIAQYNAVIATDSKVVTASSDNDFAFTGILSQVVNVSAIDSRTNSTTVTKSLEWIEYVAPNILATLERKNGVDQSALLKLEGSYMDVDFGLSRNTITVCEIRYKKTSESTFSAWTNIIGFIDFSTGVIANKASNELPIVFEIAEYDFEIRVKDSLAYATKTGLLSDGRLARDVIKDSTGNYHTGHNGMADLRHDHTLSGEPTSKGWNKFYGELAYASPTSLTTDHDTRDYLDKGYKIKYDILVPLSHYWTFDTNNAPSVGSAVMTNIGTPTYSAGKFGNALTLNGSSQALQITDAAAFKPASAFTIRCRIKASGAGTYRRIFQSYSINPNASGFFIELGADNKIGLLIGNNTGALDTFNYKAIKSVTTITDNNWHDIVISFGQKQGEIYIDGKLEIREFMYAPVYAATNYVRIGCGSHNGVNGSFFNGQIDDFEFYNDYAMDELTVKKLYDANVVRGITNLPTTNYSYIMINPATNLLTLLNSNRYLAYNSVISNVYYSNCHKPFKFPFEDIKGSRIVLQRGTTQNIPATSATRVQMLSAYARNDDGVLGLMEGVCFINDARVKSVMISARYQLNNGYASVIYLYKGNTQLATVSPSSSGSNAITGSAGATKDDYVSFSVWAAAATLITATNHDWTALEVSVLETYI